MTGAFGLRGILNHPKSPKMTEAQYLSDKIREYAQRAEDFREEGRSLIDPAERSQNLANARFCESVRELCDEVLFDYIEIPDCSPAGEPE